MSYITDDIYFIFSNINSCQFDKEKQTNLFDIELDKHAKFKNISLIFDGLVYFVYSIPYLNRKLIILLLDRYAELIIRYQDENEKKLISKYEFIDTLIIYSFQERQEIKRKLLNITYPKLYT